MAIPLGAIAAMSLIPSAVKGISGARQAAAAKRAEKKLKQPELQMKEYKIPGQVGDVTKRVKMGALDTALPGADIMKSQVEADRANAIQAARQAGASSADVLSTIASMGSEASKTKRDIALAGIKRQDEMQSDINRQLMVEAGYEDRKQAADQEKYLKEFEYNKDRPFQSEAATISALRQAGNQNIYGAVSDLASLGTSIMMTQGMMPGANQKTPGPSITPPPRTITNGPIMGPPSYDQWMAQGKPAIGPPTFDQWAAQNPIATGITMGPPSFQQWMAQGKPAVGPPTFDQWDAQNPVATSQSSNRMASPQPTVEPVVTQEQFVDPIAKNENPDRLERLRSRSMEYLRKAIDANEPMETFEGSKAEKYFKKHHKLYDRHHRLWSRQMKNLD